MRNQPFSSEKWILKNIYGFSKEKKCAQKGAKIILDMIQGTKRVLSSQELVNSTKLNLSIFQWVSENTNVSSPF